MMNSPLHGPLCANLKRSAPAAKASTGALPRGRHPGENAVRKSQGVRPVQAVPLSRHLFKLDLLAYGGALQMPRSCCLLLRQHALRDGLGQTVLIPRVSQFPGLSRVGHVAHLNQGRRDR